MSMKKFPWHHRESNPRPSDLQRSASTNCATACPFIWTEVAIFNCVLEKLLLSVQVWNSKRTGLIWFRCEMRIRNVKPTPPHGATAPVDPGPHHHWGFRITLTHTTLSTISLDKWSARRRDLYLPTHNAHKRKISTLPVGSEPTIPATQRPYTHTLDRPASGIV